MTLIEQFKAHKDQLPEVSDREVDLYQRHFELLCSWNERMNLVSRKSIESAFGIHYADSVFISAFTRPHLRDLRLSDLGTGAGFPGLMFAIRYPEVKVSVYERSLKKGSFLSVAVTQLELPNVEVREGFENGKSSETFLARAVLPPMELLKFFRSRLGPTGQFVMNIGSQAEYPETRDFERVAESSYVLPNDHGPRKLALFQPVPRGTKK